MKKHRIEELNYFHKVYFLNKISAACHAVSHTCVYNVWPLPHCPIPIIIRLCNIFWTDQSRQQKQHEKIWMRTSCRLLSTFSLTLQTPKCLHNFFGCIPFLLKNIDFSIQMSMYDIRFLPKRRILLSSETTRTPHIGLGRLPPDTCIHSPAEG